MTRKERAESLKKRYGNRVASTPKRMGPGPRQNHGMKKGTPSNTKASVKRLLQYLEQDKLKVFFALSLCCIKYVWYAGRFLHATPDYQYIYCSSRWKQRKSGRTGKSIGGDGSRIWCWCICQLYAGENYADSSTECIAETEK